MAKRPILTATCKFISIRHMDCLVDVYKVIYNVRSKRFICILLLLGIPSRVRIHPPEHATLLPETELLPKLLKIKLRPTAQSEGYDTMTQHSSDITSEVKHIHYLQLISMFSNI